MSIGLDPDYDEFCWIWIESGLKIASLTLDQDRIWTELVEKNWVIFVAEKLYLVNFLDVICTWALN